MLSSSIDGTILNLHAVHLDDFIVSKYQSFLVDVFRLFVMRLEFIITRM